MREDPQLEHRREPLLRIGEVEPADLLEPPQPVAQGVGVDEQSRGGGADVAERVEPCLEALGQVRVVP